MSFNCNNNVLNSLKPSTKDGREIKSALLAFVEDFKAQFNDMFVEMKNEFLEITRSKDNRIQELEDEVTLLKNQLSKFEEKIEDQDAYERRDTLIISGDNVPVVTPNENCSQLVTELMRDNLNLTLNASEISVSHRLGPKPTSQKPDKRKIIIKLCRRDDKINIIRCARRVKPEKLFINESLTIQRQQVIMSLRKAKRQFPNLISGVTSIEGSVYAWTRPTATSTNTTRDTRHKINGFQQLENFCQNHLQLPSANFLSRTN